VTNGSGDYRLFDYDQTHVLSALLSYEVYGFTFGARARFTTGAPRLRVVNAYADIADDRYEPLFEGGQFTRFPAFYSLDLRRRAKRLLSAVSRGPCTSIYSCDQPPQRRRKLPTTSITRHGKTSLVCRP